MKNDFTIQWTGQAGYILRTEGFTLGLDLFLSDACALPRIIPSPVKPEELSVDWLLASHHHDDHLDSVAAPVLLQNPASLLFGPPLALEKAKAFGIRPEQCRPLNRGDTLRRENLEIRAVFCDHGDGPPTVCAPDALGFEITVNGVKIAFTGDTCYRERIRRQLTDFAPDILILPINGQFGNLNEAEAARLAAEVNPRVTIPCHFWCCWRHGGTPMAFLQALEQTDTSTRPELLPLGKILSVQSLLEKKA